LIGTSKYIDNSFEDLPAVQNNVNTLATLLAAPAYCGLPGDRCIVMHNPSGVPETYRQLIRYAKAAEDTLIIYFAGHGLTGPRRHELYLCLTETEPDESQLPVNALSIDHIHKVFQHTPARNRILILDSCYSGRAANDFMASYDELILGQIEIKGGYTMAATPANSVALAPTGSLYTAFTGELVQLLRNGLPDGPELLSLDDIFRQLLRVMKAKDLPEPRQRGSDTAHLLALSRNVAFGHQKGPGQDDNVNDSYEQFGDLSTRARDLRKSGKHSEAAYILQRLVADQDRSLGPNHPKTLDSKQDLAFALNAAGDVTGASRILEKLFETQLFATTPEAGPPNSTPRLSIMSWGYLACYFPLLVGIFLISGTAAHLASGQLGIGNYAALVLSGIALFLVGGMIIAGSIFVSEIGRERVMIGAAYLACAVAGFLPAHSGQPWLWAGHVDSVLRDWLIWRF
jgi:hypothetical protein